MSKQQIIAQLRAASQLDLRAKTLDARGDTRRAWQIRAEARDLRDAAYRCM